MSLIICPGIHSPELTTSFLAGLGNLSQTSLAGLTDYVVFPSDRYPPYSAFHILETLYNWLEKPRKTSRQVSQNFSSNLLPFGSTTSLVFLGFSAGVVGAIGAARAWQRSGGEVKAFIAIDGWGVPLRGDFPLYQLSHDFFTHWSSAPLSAAAASFYADPPVPHLELWRSPQTTRGYQLSTRERSLFLLPDNKTQARTTAAAFLIDLLTRHGEFTL